MRVTPSAEKSGVCGGCLTTVVKVADEDPKKNEWIRRKMKM